MRRFRVSSARDSSWQEPARVALRPSPNMLRLLWRRRWRLLLDLTTGQMAASLSCLHHCVSFGQCMRSDPELPYPTPPRRFNLVGKP